MASILLPLKGNRSSKSSVSAGPNLFDCLDDKKNIRQALLDNLSTEYGVLCPQTSPRPCQTSSMKKFCKSNGRTEADEQTAIR